MDSQTIVAVIVSFWLSMTAASNAEVFVDYTAHYDTYIFQSMQPSPVFSCQPGLVQWNSSVTGPISPGTNVSLYEVTITNAGGRLMFSTFTPALSGVYTCSDMNGEAASILLTTSNPSLNILSQQPVKLYNDDTQFQLLMSSYFRDDIALDPVLREDISILYYDAALKKNFTVGLNATLTREGSYQVTVFLGDAVIPNRSTFFISVDNYNGSAAEIAFTLIKDDGCKHIYESIWRLQWPGTPLNFTCVQPCPGGVDNVSGKAYRFCSSTGYWGLSDVTQCESYTYRYLTQQVLLPNISISQGLGIVALLFGYSQPQDISILPLDLKNSVIIISRVLNLLTTNLQQDRVPDVQDTVIILDVINNLLNETNLVGWQILQTINPDSASSLLLKSTESYGLYVASAINTTTNLSLSRSSVVLEALNVNTAPNQADIIFPNGINTLFANASFSSIDAKIVIPGDLLLERTIQSSSVPVVNMIIKNINMFLPTNGAISQQVQSLILSSQVAVEDGGFASLVLKKRPVSIIFKLNNPYNVTSQYQCSFWNFSSSSWSSEGMLPPTSNGSFVQCYSTHLTSFAVLLAVENFPDSEALTIISYIGCGISMAGLLATILFFLTFRKKLFEKLHTFIHLNLAIALFLAFLTFVAGFETAKRNEAACKVVAALLQYFWLSAFCWMLSEGVMLYLMLVVVFSSLSKKWWFFFLLGWVPPLVFVIIGLAVRSDYYVVRGNDGKTISYCWMSTAKGTIWAFAAPVVTVILVNIVFLIMVIVMLFRKGRPKLTKAKSVKGNMTTVIYLIKSTIILLPILGCTWIFGLLSVNQYTLVFTWLFTILNSLQGFFIFISYVLRDEKIRGRISNMYGSWLTTIHSKQSKSKSSTRKLDKCKICTNVKSSTLDQSENLIMRDSEHGIPLAKVLVETVQYVKVKEENSSN